MYVGDPPVWKKRGGTLVEKLKYLIFEQVYIMYNKYNLQVLQYYLLMSIAVGNNSNTK